MVFLVRKTQIKNGSLAHPPLKKKKNLKKNFLVKTKVVNELGKLQRAQKIIDYFIGQKKISKNTNPY